MFISWLKSKLEKLDLTNSKKLHHVVLGTPIDAEPNDHEEEINLNNVLLLNPKNDEAIYMLTILKIKQSNYKEAKELIERFELVCVNFCSKKKEMKKKFEKLTP